MVREGYKQTEVGVIPEDWNVNELGNLGKFKNGINKGSEDFGHGLPFVNLMDVFGISSISEVGHLGLVNSNDAERKAYDLKEGDVLFIRSSVKPSGVGLTTIVTRDLTTSVYSGFLIRFRSNGKLETSFKKYCFLEEKFRQSVSASSTVSANTNINQDTLKKLILAYPELSVEQRSIAQALSDVDALIASLDRLIVKKRNIKTATMQQLLTGKKRLPGFSEGQGYKESAIGLIPEDWDAAKLGDVAEVIMGQSPKGTSYNREGNGLALINGPTEFTEKHPVKVQWTTEPTKLCRLEDLLICVRGSSTGRMNVANDEFCIGRGVAAIRANAKANTEYLTYQVYLAIEGLLSLSAGSTFPSVDGKAIKSIPIPCPDPQEQQAIATVLSDMDTEIAALESRLAKTQAIKQGMMQELLTGRTRLV